MAFDHHLHCSPELEIDLCQGRVMALDLELETDRDLVRVIDHVEPRVATLSASAPTGFARLTS